MATFVIKTPYNLFGSVSFHSTGFLFGLWQTLALVGLHCNIQNILFWFFPLKDAHGPHLNELCFLWKEALERSPLFFPFSHSCFPTLHCWRIPPLSTWGDCLWTVVTPTTFLKDSIALSIGKVYNETKATGRATHSIKFWTSTASWIQAKLPRVQIFSNCFFNCTELLFNGSYLKKIAYETSITRWLMCALTICADNISTGRVPVEKTCGVAMVACKSNVRSTCCVHLLYVPWPPVSLTGRQPKVQHPSKHFKKI